MVVQWCRVARREGEVGEREGDGVRIGVGAGGVAAVDTAGSRKAGETRVGDNLQNNQVSIQ